MKKSSYWALKDISCDVYHGETLGVIGRNGAGKTSLLKLMTGIINPSRGEVKRHTTRVAMLSLQVGFLPNLTGRDNAVLSGLLLGLRKNDITEAPVGFKRGRFRQGTTCQRIDNWLFATGWFGTCRAIIVR